MKKFITTIVLFATVIASAQGQFEQGMTKAFQLWKEGKNTEASDLFERIASADKTSWLPNYYVALVNTTASFGTKDKTQVNALLAKAQNALDIEMIKDQNNSELYVLQALIYTAWVVVDPMTNGMVYSGKTMEMYSKALALSPENPRAVFGKADFLIQGAKWTGIETKPLCQEVDKSIGLFGTFKPETPFSPKWGLERALETQKNCK
jgi:hypothetical protein